MRSARVCAAVVALAAAGSGTGACGSAFEEGPTGGAGATSGSGGAGGADEPCQPGATTACYTGPAGTQDVGLCKAGVKVCDADGVGYGECQGEVLPAEENCQKVDDEDCDGSPNDGCPCEPGSEMECYSGPRGTAGVGICVAGTQVCNEAGDGYGPCAGEVLPEVEDCEDLVDLDCSGFACAQPLWSKIAGDVSWQSSAATGVDAAGNVFVMGTFSGTVNLGGAPLISAGASDIFIVKYDSNGAHLWSKKFGDATNQIYGDMAVDATGNVVLAAMNYDTEGHVLVKLDASGILTFSKPLPKGPGGEAKLALDGAGNIAVAMSFDDCFDSGCTVQSAGGSDGYVAKYSPSGSPVWAKTIGGPGEDYATGVAFDVAGNLFVVGSFQGTMNLGNTAATALTSQGSSDMYVAKLDADGNHAWSKEVGGSASDFVYSDAGSPVVTGSNGNVIVGGAFSGSFIFDGQQVAHQQGADIAVFELTSGGVPSWIRPFGGPGLDAPSAIALDADGNIVLSAASHDTIDFGGGPLPGLGGRDICLAKLTPDGVHLWSRRFGDPTDQYAAGVSTGPSREIVLAGSTQGDIDFGLGQLSGAGTSDAVVVKFAP
jgi:hypothetical protein